MAWEDLPYLAAAAFASILSRLFLRRGDRARSTGESTKRRRACENDGTARGASSTHASTEGQEVATSSGYDYEIFLSFRGPDTRAGFTDILYTSLKDAGIRTFRDDEELRVGEKFAPELLQAIKQSKISIPIFSKGYASSPWCLKELVQMVECQKNGRQKIMPIFYDVAPSEVGHQIGDYAKAFHSHEKKRRFDKETIHQWKDALSAVGEIKGWDLHSETNRREGEFAKEVTKEVFRELKKAYLEVSDCLVGVDNQVDEIMAMIGAQISETRFIGIHGMGGIGKTTIAKIIYNRLSSNFEDCCFLSNIRETSKHKGVECLQKQLISNILRMKETDIDINNVDEGTRKIKERFSNKKVLLLLDDVETENHINAFVGKRDWLGKRDWFGRGSRIIITTRNKNILHFSEVYCSYELKCMDHVQSLKLFSKHAFRRDIPLDEDMNQSNRAIDIARGLPLALEVIGSLLSPIEKNKWDDILKDLETVPPDQVLGKLEISFKALGKREQHIFIDVACLFIGYEKDVVIYFWDDILCPKKSMGVLESMSLMKIDDDNKVWMHDLVRDLGREIVRRKSEYKIQELSRVWDPEEALRLLGSRKMKEKLEALRLPSDHQHYFAYENLPNLHFLEVCDSNGTSRNESLSSVLPTDVFQENSDLLPELRWLAWPNIPPTFKIMNFSMKNVVILDLSKSRITHNWEGWNHMKVMKNLKVMDLSYCDYLKRTPKFFAHSKLERLILKVCWGLVEIDKSIGQLKSLVFLDVNYCRELRKLPNTIGGLESLKELDILYSGIKKLPDSIGNLKLLNKLNISRMGIKKLPNSIGNLTSLIELDMSYSKIKELPDSIGELQNLKVVKMDGCSISKIPDALWRIKKLEVIEATAHDVNVKIGNDINRALRILELNGAIIDEVPRLPEGLTILKLSTLYMNMFLDLSNLTNLEKLELKFARRTRRDSNGESDGPVEEDPMPLQIGNLSKLESLYLRSPYVTALPTDIRSLLPQLKSLKLWCPNLSKLESPYVTDIGSLLPQLKHLLLRCPNLDCLPSLPSSLSSMQLESECVTALPTISLLPRLETLLLECPNLPCLPSLPSGLSSLWLESKCVTTLPTDISTLLPQLGFLKLRCCPNLRYLPSLPSSLGCLWLEDGKSCRSMRDLSNLKTLTSLEIIECAISEIQGLDRLENLQTLELRKLQQLEILPDLRNLNKLWRLQVSDCGKLVEIQGEFPSSLEDLKILDCGSLQKWPDLSSLKSQNFLIKGCGKLNEAISSLFPEEEVESEGGDIEFDDESEGEDDESGCESDYELEGEDDESGCESDYELEGGD